MVCLCRSDPHALEGAEGLADGVDFLFACLLFADRLPEQACQLGETGEGFTDARFEAFNLVDGGFDGGFVRCRNSR